MPPVIDFRVLGPVQLRAAGRSVALGYPRQRGVLAALLVEAPRPVSMSTLIDRVWGDEPPAGVRSTVHSHVARLRGVLRQTAASADAPPALQTVAGGYALDIDPQLVDLHRFHRLVAHSRQPDVSSALRAALLREALECWHGEPLAGMQGDWAARTRDVWQQERVGATTDWAAAERAVGNDVAVIGPLLALTAQFPFAEAAVGVLMEALRVSGRPAEALEQFTRLRTRLSDELGTEPGPNLQTLYRSILNGEPSRAMTGPAGRRPPAQLPARTSSFVGREEPLSRLDGLLKSGPDVASVAVVSGSAGVGKTALAIHWAHQVAAEFPDGQLYVDLRGFDPTGQPVDPAGAGRDFLEALGVPPRRVPAAPGAQSALLRSELAGRRMLLLLDNAYDSAQVKPLLPGSASCRVIVTSRRNLTGLLAAGDARMIALDLLADHEALQLLAERLGHARIATQPQAAAEIVARCARLPLALSLAAAHAVVRPRVTLQDLADELTQAAHLSFPLSGDDPGSDVRTVFSWSYQRLSAAAARLFRQLGSAVGPDIAVAAAASLTAHSIDDTRAWVAELTGANLIIESRPGHYSMHDLLRSYARELSSATDPETEQRACVDRLLDHYLQTAYSANRLLDPVREPLTLHERRPGVVQPEITTVQQAMTWFTAEHTTVTAAVDTAARTGRDLSTLQLAWTLWTFLNRQGYWHDEHEVVQAALAAAQRLGDLPAQARGHRTLAHVDIRLGRFDEALRELGEAVHLAERHQDLLGLAHAHHDLGFLWEQHHDFTKALRHAKIALSGYRQLGRRTNQAEAANSVGSYLAALGDYTSALAHCQQALDLHRELGDRYGEAGTLDSIGVIQHGLGQFSAALSSFGDSLTLVRHQGERYYEAAVLIHTGDTHQAAHDPAAARTAWQQALSILDDLDHPDAAQVRAKLGTR